MDKYVKLLIDNAEKFTKTIETENDLIKRRILNEKLFRFERSFIDGNKLPNNLQFKHIVFAPRYNHSKADFK